MGNQDPTYSQDSDIQDFSTLQSEAQEVIQSLDGYDFSQLAAKRLPYFIAGRALDKQEFDSSGLNKELLSSIETDTDQGKVPLLAGSYRMGKSTIGMAWKNNSKNRAKISDYGSLSDDEEELNQFDGIFIDEFIPKEKSFETIMNFIKDGKKLVISPCGLEYLQAIEDKFKESEIPTSTIYVEPASESQIQIYIEKSLGLSNNDKLSVAIAKLSGGSTLVANSICQGLGDYVRMGRPINIKDILLTTKNRMESVVMQWDESRANTNKDLHYLIPNPLIQYCE